MCQQPRMVGNFAAEARMLQCIRDWRYDASCEKLAVVLQGSEHTHRDDGVIDVIAWGNDESGERNVGLVEFLRWFPELDVGLASNECLCVRVFCV